ncbi:MAG: hypothetical protein ACK6BM_14855 [Cyanobacteriota bacterium]|jgi:hypothetical protein
MSQPSPEHHTRSSSQPPLSGRRVVVAGLVSGAAGLAITLFLRAIVANTTARLPSHELYWSTVLMGGFGVVAGMALEAVRQLQRHNPDPEYRHTTRARPTGQGGGNRGGQR